MAGHDRRKDLVLDYPSHKASCLATCLNPLPGAGRNTFTYYFYRRTTLTSSSS